MTGKLEGMEKEAETTVHCNPNNCVGCLTEKYNPLTVHVLSSEVKISQDIQPHNTIRILQPYSHTIQTVHLIHRATQYKKGTSSIQPDTTHSTPQPQSHTLQKMVPQTYSHTV
jgi:hypothetical protein